MAYNNINQGPHQQPPHTGNMTLPTYRNPYGGIGTILTGQAGFQNLQMLGQQAPSAGSH